MNLVSFRKPILLATVAISLTFALSLAAQPPAHTVVIDAKAPARPFPHYWEQMFGSGRAILTLPLFPAMRDSDAARVCQSLAAACQRLSN